MFCLCPRLSGANILGQEVYERVKAFLSAHVDNLYQVGPGRCGARRWALGAAGSSPTTRVLAWCGAQKQSRGLMDENLLVYYMKHWALFTQSIPTVNFIFRYLNKNWIVRAIDECKPYVFPMDVVSLPTTPACRIAFQPRSPLCRP